MRLSIARRAARVKRANAEAGGWQAPVSLTGQTYAVDGGCTLR